MSPVDVRIAFAIAGLVSCATSGLFVWSKDHRNSINRNFGLFNLSVAFWNASDLLILYGRPDLLALTLDRISFLGGVFFVYFNVCFYCALGEEKTPPKNIRRILSVATPFMAILVLTPFVVSDLQFAETSMLEIPGPAFPLFALYLLFGVAYGTYRLITLYRSSTGTKRVQLQYMLFAFGLGFTAVILYALFVFLIGSAGPPFYYIFEIGYTAILGFAIVQHGAFDVKTVVHKTALWLATSAIVVVPIVALFAGLRSWLLSHPVASYIILATLLLLMLVYARVVQPYVDHYFQRRKFDMLDELQRFVQEISAIKSFGELITRTLRTIGETLYVKDTRFLRTREGGFTGEEQAFLERIAANQRVVQSDDPAAYQPFFIRHHAQVAMPLTNEETLIGVIVLGEKENLSRYTRLDLDFLLALRAETTIAVQNSLLYDSLEQKVQFRTQELEDSNRKLQELDELKTKFFAAVSHELRTPLTLILAPLESLIKEEGTPLPESVRRHVSVMHQNGLRLLKQINNLLDLTKLDAGRMKLQFRPGDIGAFFRGLIASVAPMAEKKHIELIGEEASQLPERSYFDPDRLEKVVLNLLFNAIKFSNSGGRVTLRWGRSAEGQLQVQVMDTGIGISESDLPKLFKRFSQVDATTSRRYEGTGIGLALAKEIVELHGGRINVNSEPGRGSTFTVTLPLLLEAPHDESTEEQAPQESDGAAPTNDWTRELHVAAERHLSGVSTEPTVAPEPSFSPANGRQVLIVEDNPDMREFIAFELQGDYRVLKASNGREGVGVAVQALPDLIISDVMMPEMDGYQLCRAIRGDERTKHIPIILLTARADMAMKIEGLEHGADDYLTKPFNAQELRAKIKSLLELRRLEREIQQRNEALEATLTELKNTQAQLVQSEKMAGLGLLVAGMAHEINNPISFAKNSLIVLQRAWAELKPLLPQDRTPVDSVEDVDASLGIVKNGVTRTEEIVGQLKAFVRKDQNQKIECSVQDGLESTLSLIHPMAGRGLVVHADLQSTRAVFAVPGKLNQVWMNLLQNAVQAIGATGEIWVESRDHEHTVTVSVRDSGPGIKPEHMARLFEPFFTTKPVGKGTGLGLSVSYQIIQDVGGRIDVRSEPGQGAEFTVVLPVASGLSKAA
ncbi:MAG: ATP-binding protein [Nitrospirota bacterium]